MSRGLTEKFPAVSVFFGGGRPLPRSCVLALIRSCLRTVLVRPFGAEAFDAERGELHVKDAGRAFAAPSDDHVPAERRVNG